MNATNMAGLEKMLLSQLKKAMDVSSAKMLKDMEEETADFYNGGSPVMYVRTGALGRTPNTTAVSSIGNGFYFEAYLDQSGGYSTGSHPTMTQVLELANYGKRFTTSGGGLAKPTVGRSGFWERAESRMESTFYSTMAQFFN